MHVIDFVVLENVNCLVKNPVPRELVLLAILLKVEDVAHAMRLTPQNSLINLWANNIRVKVKKLYPFNALKNLPTENAHIFQKQVENGIVEFYILLKNIMLNVLLKWPVEEVSLLLELLDIYTVNNFALAA